MKKKPLIILTGPTAVGKTELSVKLAKAVGGEIISADSIQVYRHMDIGSAKITAEEMQGIPHYLIDELEPSEEFNIYYFQQKAKQYVSEIYERGHIPILVGGTGFYIQALLYDIDFSQEENDFAYRRELEQMDEKTLFEMLERIDGEAAQKIHENNKKRVIRALEYHHLTGKKISEHNEEQKEKESPYDFSYFVLNMERKLLYERINRRVDLMMEQGLAEEVRHLKEMGYARNLVSMQGIGYKEMYAWLDGECSYEEAVEKIKTDTRRFAKRQLTWFRREREVQWLQYEDFGMEKERILQYIIERIQPGKERT